MLSFSEVNAFSVEWCLTQPSTETLKKHHIPHTELLDYNFSLNLFSLWPWLYSLAPHCDLVNHRLASPSLHEKIQLYLIHYHLVRTSPRIFTIIQMFQQLYLHQGISIHTCDSNCTFHFFFFPSRSMFCATSHCSISQGYYNPPVKGSIGALATQNQTRKEVVCGSGTFCYNMV